MDKKQIFGGLVRGAVNTASLFRIAYWVKQRPKRKLAIGLYYNEDVAVWTISLLENGNTVCQVSSDTFENVTAMAVVALGKDF